MNAEIFGSYLFCRQGLLFCRSDLLPLPPGVSFLSAGVSNLIVKFFWMFFATPQYPTHLSRKAWIGVAASPLVQLQFGRRGSAAELRFPRRMAPTPIGANPEKYKMAKKLQSVKNKFSGRIGRSEFRQSTDLAEIYRLKPLSTSNSQYLKSYGPLKFRCVF